MKIRLTEYADGGWVWEFEAEVWEFDEYRKLWRREDFKRYPSRPHAVNAAAKYVKGLEKIRLARIQKNQEEIEL